MLLLEKSYTGYRQSEIDLHHGVVGDYAKHGVGIPLRKPNVDKQLSKGFKIYPNPTSQSFTVEYAIDKNCEAVLYITNSIGQVQLTKAIDNNKNSVVIDSENYAGGIYSCRIICAENILFQQKLIIIK